MDLRLDAYGVWPLIFFNKVIDTTCPERLLYAKVHP